MPKVGLKQSYHTSPSPDLSPEDPDAMAESQERDVAVQLSIGRHQP